MVVKLKSLSGKRIKAKVSLCPKKFEPKMFDFSFEFIYNELDASQKPS